MEPRRGRNEKPTENQWVPKFMSGERGIRTPGASQHGGFQDRCNRPLYHLSSARTASKQLHQSGCKGTGIFSNLQIFRALFCKIDVK